MLALAAQIATATAPLRGEYHLQQPNAGTPGGGGGGGGQASNVPGHVGSSGGDSALPALLLGFAAIGSGGAALAYVRRRRSGPVS